ncbi:hypothetical protein D3C71_1720340 [compost metagenome]
MNRGRIIDAVIRFGLILDPVRGRDIVVELQLEPFQMIGRVSLRRHQVIRRQQRSAFRLVA